MRIVLARILFFAAIVLLGLKPAAWLITTWLDPVYGSHGLLTFSLVAGLALWSLSSAYAVPPSAQKKRLALCLLLATAIVRLLGQVLAINVIGALALVIDIYAFGLLFGLGQRRRPVSAGWLAILFALTLPLERIVQRSVGFALQQLSAQGACFSLDVFFENLVCQGVRILLAGKDVLVDLPCSGARGLLLLLMLYVVLAALYRPRFTQASSGLLITLCAALMANIVRICLLALGIAFADRLSISVMETPWHDLIGLLSLLLGALPVVVWAHGIQRPAGTPIPENIAVQTKTLSKPHSVSLFQSGLITASGFSLTALIIVMLPAHPVDIARASDMPLLPASLAGTPARKDNLSEREQAYFTRFGGGAARSWYGDFGLLLVSTSAPIRHLHAPDECLSGIGHRVEYGGLQYARLPSAVYRSVDPAGNSWRIAVTYVSERGQLATSVAEVIWHWLQQPGNTWTMVQRISPWSAPAAQLALWDDNVARALDLPVSTSSQKEIRL